MNNFPDDNSEFAVDVGTGSRYRGKLAGAIAPFITTIIAALALLSLVSARWGWRFSLELCSHFQLQYFLASSLLLVALLLTCRKPWIWLGLGLVALQSCQIVPWYLPVGSPFGISRAAETASTLRVLVTNVNAYNRDYATVLSLVEETAPDLAVFMEVDRAWQAQFDSLQGMLPYHSGQALPFHWGLLVYSRQPLKDLRIHRFPNQKNISVLGTLDFNGKALSLVATHPPPPVNPTKFRHRNQQLAAISDYIDSLNDSVLLVGDLNVSLWSPYYHRLERRSQLRNVRRGFGILPTWSPLYSSWVLSIPIDHALVSKELVATRVEVGPDIGSDHRPLIAELSLKQTKK